ncbi:MAG: hypothetical protein DWQ34_08550 [Planctomycetota bacterium]|nr:MAG: hypothetical protein DWQ29_24130 [Planctomycetota bacterium]REJ94473.1 MAG: hypothetical protein DWQ34_08550 [Planctomycetota bacterium]REK22582.1 MAG: hypothetical protein DWQ41_19050 [Planctomycetota bacterium]REK35995.1 MAG: hypothetical protein DWQ45_09900 [Planctomycetota bacterium]
MKRYLPVIAAGGLAGLLLLPVQGEAPQGVEEVAPIGDILIEVDARVEELEKLLESEETYDDQKEGKVRQAFGVLAVMGQAVAEHPEGGEASFSGPALREAALGFKRDATYDEAQAAYAAVKEAYEGGGDTEAAVDHEWSKLINMHPMMEEINARNARLLSVFRRPRGKPEEPVHATTIALLALAMDADTHEVKDENEIPAWHEMSKEYRELMIQVAAKVREKDGKGARELFDAANETCDRCHEKFRDAE